MIKNMIRAARRHHAARVKAKRRFYLGRDLAEFPVALGRVLNTAAQVKHAPLWRELPWRDRKDQARTALAG